MKPFAIVILCLFVAGILTALITFLVSCAVVAAERKRRRLEQPPVWQEAAIIWRGWLASGWRWLRCNLAAPEPVAPGRPGVALARVAEPRPVPRQTSCPVCGTELPGDSPEGLCAKCLFQCALSDSDHGIGNGEHDTTGHPGLPAVPTPAELAPHFPQLEILEFVGQGGMGAVYKARQLKLDRLVAIKILPREWGKDPAFAERFGREARAMARLSHPQIVGVHDFGEAGGFYYLVMEFVDGLNVRQLLHAGQLQPRQAMAVVTQVCDAMQYAHEEGIVHRDIKPENILLDKRGRVKIADFGLAKLIRRTGADFSLTGSRQIMGTVDYMAPEQRTNPQAVDHRADIYALGVVFYEMLTGELPLGRFAPPSERAQVDGRLDEVVFKALEQEPSRRYQRVSALKADVESVLVQGTLPEGKPGKPEPAAPRRGKVRAFLNSVFSVFASRSVAPNWLPAPRPGRHVEELPAARLVRHEPQRPAPRRRIVWKILALGIVASVGLTLLVRNASQVAFLPARSEPAGVLFHNVNDLEKTLRLSYNQTENLRTVLQVADREYLDMELRHTTRRLGPSGTVMVTIGGFPEEVSQLEDRTWAKIKALLDYDQQTSAIAQLPPRGALFPFGKQETRIEIRREGSTYHWKVTPNSALPGDSVEGGGRQLPRGYDRFWQNGIP